MHLKPTLSAIAAGLLLTACAHQAHQEQPATAAQEQAVAQVQAAYKAGRYAQVAQQVGLSADIQTAPRAMHAEALKLQAFSYCLLEDKPRCERSFTRLLSRYPDFELGPAERGHPMWGPTYEQVKNGAR